MREVHTLCRPFVLLASRQRGIDLSRLSFPTEDGTGVGTAECARCGFSEEIASRLGGGEVDPDNDKWYCKPCWDDFRATGELPVAPGDQEEDECDDQDSRETTAMVTEMDATQQGSDDGVAMETGNGAQAIGSTASEEEGQVEEQAS